MRNNKFFNNSLLTILLAFALALPVPAGAFAVENDTADAFGAGGEAAPFGEKTEVALAESIEEFSSYVPKADNEDFFTIDASENTTDGQLADEEIEREIDSILSGGESPDIKQHAVIDALQESELYFAKEGDGSEVEVTSKFAYQRLRLKAPYKDDINGYGAVDAVYYDGYYMLGYESEEATKIAYDALIEEYGAGSVLADIPMKMDADNYYGWGTRYMGLDLKGNAGGGAIGNKKIRVAVLDTGISRSHNIFKGDTILQGTSFVEGVSDPEDDNGHGTAVSGIIAESTYFNVEILPVKVLNYRGRCGLAEILAGIKYADENNADIINLSLGGEASRNEMSIAENDLKNIKSLLICAAGNEKQNMDVAGRMILPAELNLSNIVCVSAIASNDSFCSGFSNYGSAVKFTAPGRSVRVAYYESTTGSALVDGTSFSAPYISAAAAKVKYESKNGNASNTEIFNTLRNRAVDLGAKGKDVRCGYGCPFFCNKVAGAVTIRNTIANSAKKTNDVIWDKSDIRGGANKYEINWRAKGGQWAKRIVGNTVRGTTSGLKIGQMYEIRVRSIKDSEKGDPAYGPWSRYVYRYFHTTERIRLASKSKGTFTISWKHNPNATSYQVLFTTNKNGAGAAKNITNISKGQTSFTKKGLRSGVTYYVQIREIRNYAGKNWIGNISKPVRVRVR